MIDKLSVLVAVGAIGLSHPAREFVRKRVEHLQGKTQRSIALKVGCWFSNQSELSVVVANIEVIRIVAVKLEFHNVNLINY
jgi:hypothetical protein